jgi:hypothetical protein
LKLWTEIHGDIPVTAIAREHVSKFRILLTRLPADYSKAPRWRGMSLAAIVEAVDAADAAAPNASVPTRLSSSIASA